MNNENDPRSLLSARLSLSSLVSGIGFTVAGLLIPNLPAIAPGQTTTAYYVVDSSLGGLALLCAVIISVVCIKKSCYLNALGLIGLMLSVAMALVLLNNVFITTSW